MARVNNIRVADGAVMSSLQALREFIGQRLTAAAEEIFSVVENTVVQFEEEVDRQRRLLDIVWNPVIKLHRIKEFPQQHECKEEEEELLTDRDRKSSLDREDPDPAQIKEEQEGWCTGQEAEQPEVKPEGDTFTSTPDCEQSVQSEAEPDADQLLSQNSAVAQSPGQNRNQQPGSGDNEGSTPQRRLYKTRSHRDPNPPAAERHGAASPSHGVTAKSHECTTCGRAFTSAKSLAAHKRTHAVKSGQKKGSFKCETCGKVFGRKDHLKIHLRIHSGEKPYSCSTCGKRFMRTDQMRSHMRSHAL